MDKKKTKIITGVLAAALVFTAVNSSVTTCYASEKNGVQVIIDGTSKQISGEPENIDGSILLPMRALFEILGAEVQWSEELKEVSAVKEDISIVIKIDSPTAFVNNRVVKMPRPARIKNDTVMIPARFVSEALGAEIGWNGTDQSLTITSAAVKAAEKEPLTYEKAVILGVKKSPQMNNAIIDADKTTSQNDDFILTLGTYNLRLLQTKQGLKLADKWAQMNLNITADQTANSIKNQMDDISLKLENEKNLKQQIDYLKYKISIHTLLWQNGQISQTSLKDVESEYNMALQNLKVLQREIDSDYAKFDAIIGLPADQRNPMEYKTTYEPVGDVNIAKKILDDRAEDPYLWLLEQNVDLAEFNLNTYEYNMADKSWTLTSLDLSAAKQKLSEKIDAQAKTIQSRYDDLKLIEEKLESATLVLEQARRAVASARTQYDLGLITKVQLEETQRKIPDLEYQILEAKQKHSQLKTIFEKPYLAPEYVN